MKQGTWNGLRHVSVSLNQMQAFVIVNNVGIIIDADVNVGN